MRLFKSAPVIVILILIIASVSPGQDLLENPESVVYDAPRDRYLVSNFGSGYIVSIDSEGNQEYFGWSDQCFTGLQITGDIVYASCRQYGVKGYNLENGEEVMHVEVAGSQALNDLTVDDSGFLYVSDPQANRIFRIDPETETGSVFVDGGISSPNGLYFDPPNNRLLLCSTRNNSPIQAVSLTDSTVETIRETPLDILDGLTKDNDGNFYISSWGSNAVYRFNPDFSEYERFSGHRQSPADIFFDRENNLLCVPIFYSNEVEFLPVPQMVDNGTLRDCPGMFHLCSVYPNPFNSTAEIRFTLTSSASLSLAIFDINGRFIHRLVNKSLLSAGTYTHSIDGRLLSSGTFILKLDVGNDTVVRTVSLLK